MVIYGLTLVLLSKFLREQTPAVIQPFYDDDLSFSGHASDIVQAMRLLQHHGPSRGYFPELTKSIVVCTESEEIQAKQFLDELQFIYKQGSCYIGGFIGATAGATTCLNKWFDDQVESWVRGASNSYPGLLRGSLRHLLCCLDTLSANRMNLSAKSGS